ncbi:MAG: beta-galactosidase [Pseudomonadota bacterium]|nr:beta-galactosidase [Pseudomonadota bacterium]
MIKEVLGVGFVVISLLCMLPSSAAASSDTDFKWGLVAYHVNFPGYELYPDDFLRIAGNGIQWIRIDFAWGRLEPTRDAPFDFTYFDMVVQEARKNGLRIVGTLGTGYNTLQRPVAPLWTQALSGGDYARKIAQYADAVVERYAADVDAWALENEQHLALIHVLTRWRFRLFRPEINDRIMLALSDAVQEYDPTAEAILTVSAAGFEPFVRRMEGLIQFDSIGLYTYPVSFVPFVVEPDGFDEQIANEIALVKSVADGRDVILLETGYQTPTPGLGRTESLQARYIESIARSAVDGGAQGLFIYQYLDNPDEWLPREEAFGLVRADGERTPKPAWIRYGEVIQAYTP